MLVLGIDTSTKVASVSLFSDETGLIAEINLQVKKNFSNIISVMLDNLFKMTNYDISDIDRIAIVVGPGSFTGVRVGTALAKGLAIGINKGLVPINELDLLAMLAEKREELVIPLIDARKERVYYSKYKFGSDGSLNRLADYKDANLIELLESVKQEKCIFVGDGAISYKKLIEEYMGDKAVILSKANNIPRSLIAAELSVEREEENLYTLEPSYISKSQAEKEREKHKN